MKKFVSALSCVFLVLTGCTDMKTDDFVNSTQQFVLEKYFSGKTRAWGLFEDRFGTVRRQFVVDIEGKWDGSELTLNEDFKFSDGEKSNRVWRIRKLANGTYEGRAKDVIGVATGTIGGNSLHWRYTLDLEITKGRTMQVELDDWMFLQPHGVLMNRARMSKFGIEIGQITISFLKGSYEKLDRLNLEARQQFGGEETLKTAQLLETSHKVATQRPNTPGAR